MKLLVTEIPANPEKCLFARKEKGPTFIPIDGGSPFSLDTYYCNIDLKLCELENCDVCSKLTTKK